MSEEGPDGPTLEGQEILSIQQQLDQSRKEGIAEGARRCAARAKVLLLAMAGHSDHNLFNTMHSLFDQVLGIGAQVNAPRVAREALDRYDHEMAEARRPRPAPRPLVVPEPGSEESEGTITKEIPQSGEGVQVPPTEKPSADAT